MKGRSGPSFRLVIFTTKIKASNKSEASKIIIGVWDLLNKYIKEGVFNKEGESSCCLK